MEDFIVISDDSGSESSAGTRSGRARRLRRALSRTPGALPRRTVGLEAEAAGSLKFKASLLYRRSSKTSRNTQKSCQH